MVIYVKLLDEGTDVWRPVKAEWLRDNVYKISIDQSPPEEEEWEFFPGDIVVCKIRKFEGKDALIATEKVT